MFRHIRGLREDNNLTQSDIADILHINRTTYTKYELGEREISLHDLIKLANFYNVSVDYLLDLTNVKTPYMRAKYTGERE